MRARGLSYVGAAALFALYWSLPDGDDEAAPEPARAAHSERNQQPLVILDASPRAAASGSAVALSYSSDPRRDDAVQAWLGKRRLRILSQRSGTAVVELPATLAPGRAKLRLTRGPERSRPYELRIRATDWRKPFRNLLGGWVLLVFGVRRLARSVRAVSSLSSWRWPARAAWQITAVGAGTLLGALLQSTTTAAGLLAGGVSARRLDLQPAAAGFLGAQLGTAAAPILLGSATEPHTGLLIVAIGGLGLGFARLSRARAWAWLVLAAGLIAFAVQVLRPSFEPFLADPRLLLALDRVAPHSAAAELSVVLLGALLVALFQGPAPVLVLAVSLSQLTGNDNPRDTLLLLSGSGLGAALTGLLTMPGGPRCRALAQLNLVLGLCSTLISACTTDLWDRLAGACMFAVAPLQWNVQLLHCALAFAISQLTVTLLLVPLIPRIEGWIERAHSSARAHAHTARELHAALGAHVRAMPWLLRLALDGERAAGSAAQACIREADAYLRRLELRPVLDETQENLQVRLGCLQLQRAIETVLWQTERLTDDRLLGSVGHPSVPALPDYASQALRELHALIADGLTSLQRSLQDQVCADGDETRAREIEINVRQAELRQALAATTVDAAGLGVMAVVDALEAMGNQLFRLAETYTPAAGPTKIRPILPDVTEVT